MTLGLPHLGHGIGLRREHYTEVIRESPRIDWLEVITENFLVAGGNPRRVLRAARERYPVVLHGVSLSIGGTDPLDEQYLDEVAALADEIEPAWISDHLCWGSAGGKNSHDLLPLPYTREALRHVVTRVARVQERLGRRILLENVSSYLRFRHAEMSEAEFVAQVAGRADCGILLDLNNVFVSAHNHGFDPVAYLEAIPAQRVGQIHLAGHGRLGELLFDSHGCTVPAGVWRLYRRFLERFGARPTLVEWDEAVPPLAELLGEARTAAAVEADVLQPPVRCPKADRAGRANRRAGADAPAPDRARPEGSSPAVQARRHVA